MATTTLTSELEAVNTMLQAAGEAPVQSLALTGLLPLEQAKAVLDETLRVVLSYGWNFNTEHDYPLTPAVGTGFINLPNTTLRCDVNDEYTAVQPLARGTRLYDAKSRDYVFTAPLKATMVFMLAWDELPQAMRHYVMIKAARTFQARDFGSDTVDRFTEQDEMTARLALGQYEQDEGDANMITDSFSTSAVLMGRDY